MKDSRRWCLLPESRSRKSSRSPFAGRRRTGARSASFARSPRSANLDLHLGGPQDAYIPHILSRWAALAGSRAGPSPYFSRSPPSYTVSPSRHPSCLPVFFPSSTQKKRERERERAVYDCHRASAETVVNEFSGPWGPTRASQRTPKPVITSAVRWPVI